MALNVSVWESEGLTIWLLCPQEGGAEEEGKVWGCSWGAGCSKAFESGEEHSFLTVVVALSLAESRQAHWHWQASSCLIIITGTLRPICWTGFPVLPATGNAVVKNTFSTTFGTCGFKEKNKQEKSVNWLQSNFYCSNSKQLYTYSKKTHRKTGLKVLFQWS